MRRVAIFPSGESVPLDECEQGLGMAYRLRLTADRRWAYVIFDGYPYHEVALFAGLSQAESGKYVPKRVVSATASEVRILYQPEST